LQTRLCIIEAYALRTKSINQHIYLNITATVAGLKNTHAKRRCVTYFNDGSDASLVAVDDFASLACSSDLSGGSNENKKNGFQ